MTRNSQGPRRLVVALVAATAVVGLGGLAGCGTASGGAQAAGSTSSTPSPVAGAPSSPSAASSGSALSGSGMPATATTIMIENFAYKTPPTVAPGSTVAVMNMDGEAHTVTADSGNAFDVKSPPGQTVTFTAPTTPGSYSFHCTYHGNMHGVLVVK